MNRPVAPLVLHVVERPTDTSSEFDEALLQAGLDVKHDETVYGALARLVRPADNPIKAIVVCVDSLDAADLEFFTQVACHYPKLPVYIYGGRPDEHRRRQALALGAQAEVSVDRIITVLTAQPEDQRLEPPAAASESIPEPARSSGVPTPWKPSSDRPQRIPPGGKPRSGGEHDQDDSPPGPSTPARERLLSWQEVEALLSEPYLPEHTDEADDDRPA